MQLLGKKYGRNIEPFIIETHLSHFPHFGEVGGSCGNCGVSIFKNYRS